MLYNIYFYETQKKYSNMSKCVTFFSTSHVCSFFFISRSPFIFFDVSLFPHAHFVIYCILLLRLYNLRFFSIPPPWIFWQYPFFFFFLHFPPQRQIYGYIYIYRLSNRSSTHMLSNMMFRLCKNSKIGENFAEWIKKRK